MKFEEKKPWIQIWNEYKLEIISIVLFFSGLFLLLEQYNIRKAIWNRLKLSGGAFAWIFIKIGNVIVYVKDGTFNFFANITASDAIGITLVVGSMIPILVRVRQKMMSSEKLKSRRCPLCGARMDRVPRKFYDRFFNLFIPFRRYTCSDNMCKWSGLRLQ